MPDIDFPTLASANAEVDRLLAEMPPALATWLTVQKLDVSQARAETENKILRHCERSGCWRECQSWIRGQTEALVAAGVSKTRKVARRIAMRFARARFVGFRKLDDDMEWAPKSIRWVALHPALCADREDPAIVGETLEYEKHNPCPSQYAHNIFKHCAVTKHAESFFGRLERLALEYRKKGEADAGELTERKRVLDMKAELEKMRKKATA